MFIATASIGAKLPFATDLTFAQQSPGLVTSATFSSQSIGAAAASRVVVIRATLFNTTSSRSLASITLDGNVMNLETQANNVAPASLRVTSAIAWLPYPTGTTGTFVVTVTGVEITATWGIHPVALYDLRVASPTASGSTDTAGSAASSLSLNLNRLGGSIQVLCRAGSGTTGIYSSTGFTSHTHTMGSFAAGAVQQDGLDQEQAAATPAAFDSNTSTVQWGAFSGTTWR